jgi:hypothetical protein
MTRTTMVFEGTAQWSRTAFLRLENDKVVFDCSDSEYGPIEFLKQEKIFLIGMQPCWTV